MAGQEQPHTDESVVEFGQSASSADARVADLMAHTIDVPALATAVTRQKAADAADTLEDLDETEAAEILELMEDQAASDALAEMETPLAVMILGDLVEDDRTAYGAHLLEIMAPDDAASILRGMENPFREDFLLKMPVAAARPLRRLCDYEEESAAGIMTTDFISLDESISISAAVEVLRERELPEHVLDLPVTGQGDELVGIVSLRELLIGHGDDAIADVMARQVAAVRSDTDREHVAREFERYGYDMLPVVDASDRLLGIVTVDDVIEIIEDEQTEDVQKAVGAGAGEAVYSGVAEKLRGRMPWLVISVIVMVPATLVVLQFDDLIEQFALLAVFMPLIAALAGNAGHQALAVTLRGLALDEVRHDRIAPLIRRELIVGLVSGIALGIAVSAALFVFGSEAAWRFGVITGAAMAISMAAGTLAGASIPLIMRRLGADPAQASAIFLVMVTDAVAFSALLGIAALSIGWLQGGCS